MSYGSKTRRYTLRIESAETRDGGPLMSPRMYQGKTDAPDFPPHLDWLNTDKSLAMQDLRGRIVLLDFWTYC